MRRRRRYAALAALVASVAAATPVLANLAFGGAGDLALGRWDNAVVLFDEDGESATVVAVYDAGERDRARRLEIEQQAAPGVGMTLALMLEPDDGDTLVDGARDIRCVKARIRGLRPPHGPDVLVDRSEHEIEGLGAPDPGFVLPPLSTCRTVEAKLVEG